jgi:hypothetical protein
VIFFWECGSELPLSGFRPSTNITDELDRENVILSEAKDLHRPRPEALIVRVVSSFQGMVRVLSNLSET